MELKKECDFGAVFDDCIEIRESLSGIPQPRTKAGHVRADYDGRRWWTNFFPFNKEMMSDALGGEIDETMEALLELFPDLDALRQYCESGRAVKAEATEYNCYRNGELGNYWIRLITRSHDYNIYCHVYAKR